MMAVVTTRLVATSDAPELAALLAANRTFLAPYEPFRPEEFYTAEGQRTFLEDVLRTTAAGMTLPHVIVDDGRIVGRITLSTITRGPFLSASVGYWVAESANGRGVASAALARIVGIAFGELGLHRVEAGTMVHNVASQRVLERAGFEVYGMAPKFLFIDGAWRDHRLYQRILHDDPI